MSNFLNEITVGGTTYDINDKRIPSDLNIVTQVPGGISTAGAKGWYFKDWVEVDAQNNIYDMELIDADKATVPDSNLFKETIEGQVVYPTLSAKASYSANFSLEVQEIVDPSTCKLRVKYTDQFMALKGGSPGWSDMWHPDQHLYNSLKPGYVWNPEKPDIGTVQIGVGAVAIGGDNKANEYGSLSIGGGNLVDGRYGFSNGEENVVSYSSAAIGHNNKVYGYNSLAVGQYNRTCGFNSVAIGVGNTAEPWDSFVSGVGNKALLGAPTGISIRGRYASVQDGDHNNYIDVVGFGDDDANRKNIFALSKDGNLFIKSNLFVRCGNDSSGGINFTGAYEQVGNEIRIENDYSDPYEIDIPGSKHCVKVWVYVPSQQSATPFRIFVNDYGTFPDSINSKNSVSFSTLANKHCNAEAKFDCIHGFLESWCAKNDQQIGGYGTMTGYQSEGLEPVQMNSITKIILCRTYTSGNKTYVGTIPGGTKIKVFAY